MQIQNATSGMSAGANRVSGSMSNSQDSQIQSIQKQIANVQGQMQKLAGDNTMTPEQKMDKRKELQQEIQELNQQLTQRQMEIQKEKREKAAQAEPKEAARKTDSQSAKQEISTAAMNGILQADAAMNQVNTVQSVKNGMEGKTKVLAAEIATDQSRGGSTQAKEAELSALEGRIDTAYETIGEKVAEVGDKLEEGDKKADETKGSEKTEEGKRVDGKVNGQTEEEQQTNAVSEPKAQNKFAQTEGQYVDIWL